MSRGQARRAKSPTIGLVDVITRTLEAPPPKATQWSTRSMAEVVGLSKATISRIWQTFGLQSHRLETFKLSADPQFVEKVRDIVGLYLNPPDHAVVLCLDEKSQVQALDRTRPLLPMRPGIPARQTHDYIRHGTTSLFAALNVATGKVIGHCHRRHRHQELLKFLKHVDAPVAARRRRARDHGQLRDAQSAQGGAVVCPPPPLSRPFHADECQLAQSSGAVLREDHDPTHSARHLRQRPRARNRDR